MSDDAPSLLSLPLHVREAILTYVLAVAQPLYLFRDHPSRIEVFAPAKPRQWTALLYTNRQLSRESSAVLYASNAFALLDQAEEQTSLLRLFLDRIGPTNSAALNWLCLDFPLFQRQAGKFEIHHDSLQRVELIRQHCDGLTTLEFGLNAVSKRNLEDTLTSGSENAHDVLAELDNAVRTISSLGTIVARVHGGALHPDIARAAQKLGWVVSK
ncbi:hypothetical protein BDZ85DRAFT_10796 [Elsinoe ampelina]|uniref:Uncharacterized protein n=1 Tax=Elsinoe ampelina TaxID=302913 RepID=A0A6A6GQJ2_9PEZI|nr:hypothetical protein BDZ85DRAFT_10796 [Elsinoe ampelina]